MRTILVFPPFFSDGSSQACYKSLRITVLITSKLLFFLASFAVYVTAKQYPCCTVLDMGGGIWTGIIIAGCFTFVQCILAMVLIGMFDKLKLGGCCIWYGTKAGKAVLQSKDTRFPDTAELEAGTTGQASDSWQGGMQNPDTQEPMKPPRQSRIFGFFGRRSNSEASAGRKSSISIIARSSSAQVAPGDGLRRRSTNPPPVPTAPFPPHAPS